MRADRKLYFELASRPYEKPLVEELSKTTGTITHAQMMGTALKVANNDRTLAILTLANFTKNMAAIERRQMEPDKITPSLRDSYTKEKIDSIFNRIEGYADDPTERYNKEGSIYHFYSSMFAATQIGSIASIGVGLYNAGQLITDEKSADAIKAAAGDLGSTFYWAETKSENIPIPAFFMPF